MNVEVTSAHMPGRKMGEEYKFDTGAMLDPVEDWIERANAIPTALDDAIRRKIEKRYSSPAWLVVYLNLNEYGIRQQQTEAGIAQAKQRYRKAPSRAWR
jgi:hypothetical protein